MITYQLSRDELNCKFGSCLKVRSSTFHIVSQIFDPTGEGIVGQVTKVNKMAFDPSGIAALSQLLKPPEEDEDSSDVS